MEFGKDPSLSEILDDPIVVAVMNRDGIDREHVQLLMEQMRRRLRARQERLAA
ncbi:hypothetical protein [Azospirillum sp. TSO22-1]|uniref:hypothetical protein n=1 Tax=Azospirillum sp. TSO22-1 TaxID=716789 RepID=UPI0018EEADD2|nr:hypothetical protein [Azospirillum sp. TSO22-1]